MKRLLTRALAVSDGDYGGGYQGRIALFGRLSALHIHEQYK